MRDSRSSQGRPRRMNGRKNKNRNGDAVGTYVGDAWSLAQRTARGLNEIRKLINVEQKYFDRAQSAVTPTQAGTVVNLVPMGQGDDITQRDGDSIKLQRFFLDLHITRSSASTAKELVRVLVVRDLQNDGTAVAGADVVAQASTVYAPICQVNVLNGPAYNKRFSVVFDEVVTLDEFHPNRVLKLKSVHDCHIYYRGSGTTAADQGNGSIHCCLLTDATANLPSVDFISRVEFTDN